MPARRSRREHARCVGQRRALSSAPHPFTLTSGTIQMTDHRPISPGGLPAGGAAAAGAAVVLALALGACADAPTKPPAAALAAPVASAPARSPTGLAGQTLLDDATTRLLPSLAEQMLRGRLQDRLAALGAALEAGDAAATRRQLALTRKLVAASARKGDGADLGSLTLALDEIEAQLDAPATTQP
jgi:hypothetical protein